MAFRYISPAYFLFWYWKTVPISFLERKFAYTLSPVVETKAALCCNIFVDRNHPLPAPRVSNNLGDKFIIDPRYCCYT